jgi:FAD/FMN-containing dehydrogenase
MSATPVWTNWSGSVCCEPSQILRPASELAVAERVAWASSSGTPLRVVGAGHSGTPLVATDGVLLCLDELAGIESHDLQQRTAVVRAGTKLCDLGGPLLELGMGMENLGDIDTQALGGAVGTGTHGTGRKLGNLSSQVEAVRLVTAAGEIRDFSYSDDPDTMRALRVALGSLGVFTALRLRLLPAYRLHERIRRQPIDSCLEQLDDAIQAHRHFEFFWMPRNDMAEMKTLEPTSETPSDLPDRPYERIGWSPHIIASIRDVKFFEMEYAIPAEQGPACFRELRARMQQRHPEVLWPVEYRTVAPDDAFLSNAYERPTVTLSVHQDGTQPYREFFQDVEPIFWSYRGRPHWGKIHTLDAIQLCELYPGWERFMDIRDQLDPTGCFLNLHLRKIFGI